MIFVFFVQSAVFCSSATRTTIKVKKGDTFSIKLESNKTTGYSWQVADNFDKTVVALTGSDYEIPSTELVGVGGVEIWDFSVLSAGKTRLDFSYQRPWEKSVAPVKEASFEIVVEGEAESIVRVISIVVEMCAICLGVLIAVRKKKEYGWLIAVTFLIYVFYDSARFFGMKVNTDIADIVFLAASLSIAAALWLIYEE